MMKMAKKRTWMYVFLALVILIAILILTGRKSVHHEILINAPREKVWGVLTDMASYEEWNPTMKLVKGEVLEGNSVTYQFTQDADNVSEIPATVKEIIPNELLNQTGGIPLILTYNHKYILEPHNNATKVTIHEDYRGLGVNFWNPEPVQEAYERLNKALKLRSEE